VCVLADGCKFLEKGLVRHPDGSDGPLPRYFGLDDVREWAVGSEVRVVSHMNVLCHVCMSYATYQCRISRMNEACHV